VRNIAAKTFGKSGFVVGVDLRVVAATRHRNVRQATIDEFLSPLFGVHMDEHAVRRLTLTAVACHRVAVVEMRILSNVERYGTARVETDSEIATFVDPLDRAPLTVGNALVSIRGGELYAVAFTERSVCLAVQRHAL
jgi:hypothetical protein